MAKCKDCKHYKIIAKTPTGKDKAVCIYSVSLLFGWKNACKKHFEEKK